ncbi:hypothetical protein Fmac_019439 [Flemingia macrophylla]|uniref:Uncharacterized protein n=1 Tax=Flemingia macrophylla TaxID=520843 RepID=A0ABD1M7S8_9FABA
MVRDQRRTRVRVCAFAGWCSCPASRRRRSHIGSRRGGRLAAVEGEEEEENEGGVKGEGEGRKRKSKSKSRSRSRRKKT